MKRFFFNYQRKKRKQGRTASSEDGMSLESASPEREKPTLEEQAVENRAVVHALAYH